MKPKVIRVGRGSVDHLLYECKNPETGCSYKIETNAMLNAEMKAMRSDGSEAKL